MEGFYARLIKKIALPSKATHQFDFLEDIIRNDKDMKSQRNKKSYWHTYNDTLQEIHEIDPTYDPFPNRKDWGKRIRIALTKFAEVYETFKEKLGYGKKVKLTIVQDK